MNVVTTLVVVLTWTAISVLSALIYIGIRRFNDARYLRKQLVDNNAKLAASNDIIAKNLHLLDEMKARGDRRLRPVRPTRVTTTVSDAEWASLVERITES